MFGFTGSGRSFALALKLLSDVSVAQIHTSTIVPSLFPTLPCLFPQFCSFLCLPAFSLSQDCLQTTALLITTVALTLRLQAISVTKTPEINHFVLLTTKVIPLTCVCEICASVQIVAT